MYDDFFQKAHELQVAGVAFATATVVRAEKPTSGKPGDKAIITESGELYGWVGGSCAQPTVVREAQAAMAENRGRLLRLSREPSEPRSGIEELPMTCFSGGTLDIYIEPQQPRPRLMIVGKLPVASALAELGKAMSYRVLSVDVPGDEGPLAGSDETLDGINEIESRADRHTYVVVATHGNYDDLALEKALASEAPYVALVASRKRAGSIREYLERRDLTPEQIGRLKAPAGLDIGARRGDEIALSVLAEIIQVRAEQLREAEAASSEVSVAASDS